MSAGSVADIDLFENLDPSTAKAFTRFSLVFVWLLLAIYRISLALEFAHFDVFALSSGFIAKFIPKISSECAYFDNVYSSGAICNVYASAVFYGLCIIFIFLNSVLRIFWYQGIKGSCRFF